MRLCHFTQPRWRTVALLVLVAGVGCDGCDDGGVGQLRADPVAQSPVNFGDIYPGFFFLQTSSLSNEGLAPLKIESVRFVDDAFSLATSAPETLAPGESVGLTIRAVPTAIGPVSTSVDLQTDVGTVTIRIIANVTEAPVCDDANICTDDVLTARSIGGAECVFTNREGSCDDGNACTIDTACVLGVCTGAAVDCDDGVPCTNDLCQADIGCVFNPIDDRCDDGDPCSDNLCTETGCTYPIASDFTPCGDVACDIAELCVAGACEEVPAFDGLPCDDGVEGSVGAVCEDGVCLQGDVAPDVSIVWSNAEHTDLFYDVTSLSSIDDTRVAISTRRQGERDAVHILSAADGSGLVYDRRIPNLEGGARFYPLGANRFARVEFDRIPGRTRVEVLFEISAGEFVIETQTSYNVAVPLNAQDGVASFAQGVAFCAGSPDANGTIATPLSLVRIDLSDIGNPERMNDLPDPAADPCRGDQGFFFAQASGDFMAVGSDAGGFLGEAIYFFQISDAGAERIGIADGRWRQATIGPGTFVFQRVDDDAFVYARFNGESFASGTLTSLCLAEPGIRPFVVSDGATYWQTVGGVGVPNFVCRVDVPAIEGPGEIETWAGTGALGDYSVQGPGVVAGNIVVRHLTVPDDERTVGQLLSLTTNGADHRIVRNQGQVWDLRRAPNGDIVFHANIQGALIPQNQVRNSDPIGFDRAPPPGVLNRESIAATKMLASGDVVGSVRYTPPFAGHCDDTLVETCFAPATFGVELGRYTTTYQSDGLVTEASGSSYSTMTSATKIDGCLGVGTQANVGAIGDFGSESFLRVVSLCTGPASVFVGNLSPRPSDFFRLRDSFPHDNTHISADIIYVTPASSTPFDAEMVLIDVQQNTPGIIATVPLSLDSFATSAAYRNRVWAVVEQPLAETQTTLTVIDVDAQSDFSVGVGVTSTKYPARVLLVHEGYIYVNGVRPAEPTPFAEDTPFLNVYKRVGGNLFLAIELENTRNFTAMVPLDDGSILAADDAGWRTFVLTPNPPDP